jgi:hypothetical protein
VVFSIWPRKKTPEHAVENTELTSAKKSTQFKTMLGCFFNHKGIVHYEFIAQGQTLNEECYLEVQTRLQESVQKKRPGLTSGFSTVTVPLRIMH